MSRDSLTSCPKCESEHVRHTIVPYSWDEQGCYTSSKCGSCGCEFTLQLDVWQVSIDGEDAPLFEMPTRYSISEGFAFAGTDVK